MTYSTFLENLLHEGRVRVPPLEPLAEEELAAGDQVLLEAEKHARLELPGEAPHFNLPASRWAGVRFFRAAQFAVYRDLEAEVIERELHQPCPVPESAEVCYSVDLVFRYLPDLLRFARSAAEQDPLVMHLRNWCRQWPLSSVGVEGLFDQQKVEDQEEPKIAAQELPPISGFVQHAGLRQLYIDRVLARGDRARLKDPVIAEAARAALGIHHSLAPETAKLLEDFSSSGKTE